MARWMSSTDSHSRTPASPSSSSRNAVAPASADSRRPAPGGRPPAGRHPWRSWPAAAPRNRPSRRAGRGWRASARHRPRARPARSPASGSRRRPRPSARSKTKRSALEWLMSRSCQSAMFSRPTRASARSSRAKPLTRSARIGLRLCGIALLPCWPAPNGSNASPTSVRCRCRTSSAIRSSVPPRIASDGQQLGMAVAADHLGRGRVPASPSASQTCARPRR